MEYSVVSICSKRANSAGPGLNVRPTVVAGGLKVDAALTCKPCMVRMLQASAAGVSTWLLSAVDLCNPTTIVRRWSSRSTQAIHIRKAVFQMCLT